MINTNQQKIDEILSRGVDEVIDKEHLKQELVFGKQLRVKFGIDPTSPDLHLGHSVPLRKLRQFQGLGHKIVLLIGDFTATIGDPSGRMTLRPKLTEKQVKSNMKDYIKQAAKILDIKKTEIRYNNEWYSKKGIVHLMDLASKFTVARILERDDFKKRIKEDVDISMMEIVYPLLQGYDSVELKADVELGGRDQKFNLLMGRKVQKRYGMKEQDVMMLPLLEGLDGAQKMSKSLGNYIGLTDPADDMFGKIMSIPDELMWKYFALLTDVSSGRIAELKDKKIKSLISPIEIKIELANEIVKIYYGPKIADESEKKFNKIHRDKELPGDMPIFKTEKQNYPILDLLCDTGLAPSKNEAKRLVLGGAVELITKNGELKITDWNSGVGLEDEMVLRAGKRRFVKIRIK